MVHSILGGERQDCKVSCRILFTFTFSHVIERQSGNSDPAAKETLVLPSTDLEYRTLFNRGSLPPRDVHCILHIRGGLQTQIFVQYGIINYLHFWSDFMEGDGSF